MNILQPIFSDHYEEIKYTLKTRPVVLENIEKMIHCSDPAYGGAMFGCASCGALKFVPFRCKSRFCPSCGNLYSIQRTTSMSFKIIQCVHRHCVFTIPEELRIFFRRDRSLLNCLFHSVRDVILRLFRKLNKAEHFTPGFICVLHTFGRSLQWNPHIHVLISEVAVGRITPWKRVKHFNYSLLRKSFCAALLNRLHSILGPSFKSVKSAIYRNHCNGFYVYAKPNHCNPSVVSKYIGRHLGRPVIATSRIDSYSGSHVTLDANGITYDSVYARSSHVFLYNCGLYNALQGLECYLAQGNMKDCCGSCSWSIVSYASLVIASGTVPAGSRGTGENGLLYASNVTIDYGTAIPTITPDETGILYATTTKSWRGGWRTDTLDVIQGVYYDSGYSSSLNWNRGCMWFSNAMNLLSGCTVKSATLTLHRKTGSGSSAAKSVYLCAITNTSASGTPSIAKNYGSIGTIGRDKQVTFAIPVDAVQGLADGRYGGLCLYETPYDFGSSTYSNAYMRMSGTDTNYEPYIECVYGGSTAVG